MGKPCWESKAKKVAIAECIRTVCAAVLIIMATYQMATKSEVEFRSFWPYFASLAFNICVQLWLANSLVKGSEPEQDDAESFRLLNNWVMYSLAILCHKVTVLAAITFEHTLVLQTYWYIAIDLPVQIGLLYVVHRLVQEIKSDDISNEFWKSERGRLYIKNIARSYEKVPEEDILVLYNC